MIASSSRFAESLFWYLLALTGCSILLFEFGPERVLDIKEWPLSVTVQQATDAAPGAVRYLPSADGNPGVECILAASPDSYPNCGLILTLTSPAQGINLARFGTLRVRLGFTGKGEQDWRFYLRNYSPEYNPPGDPLAPKFNEIIFRQADYGKTHEVPLDVFTPATWWIKRYNVPLHQQGANLNRVYAIEVVAGSDMLPGKHGVVVEELQFHGPWLDATLFYRLILLVWFLYGCAVFVIHHLSMTRRLQHAHQARLEMEALNLTLSEESRRSREAACYDPLTGALNRLGGERLLAEIDELACSFIYLDVDHFKQINDTHGHPVGDEVLKHLVSEILRHCDALCHLVRWGGEEFVLVCFHYDRLRAASLAERLRVVLAAYPHWPSGLRVTASFGVAERAGDPLELLLKRADEALYQAKKRGRNRVACR
ncbi:GGDEF domain-containing protein [Aeromonas sobria]|uniref:GGDEF domain-containing protein n=1 Tax=Aeromonas sobria TaxID=646 RepID=UPI001118FDE5|nr:GGDEF domain-containing protein [Aeromonas sobria]TNI88293.1 GGDEF domain-containing protein [Aeromonas sobria]